jgi:hypothetical protein
VGKAGEGHSGVDGRIILKWAFQICDGVLDWVKLKSRTCYEGPE